MMPDEIAARAYRDGERVDAAMHGYSYLSPWMAHWKHTSYKPTKQNTGLSAGCKVNELKEESDVEKRDLLGGSDVGSDSSMHVDEEEIGKLKNASFDSKSFLISRLSQNKNGRLPLQREEKNVLREGDGKSGKESSFGGDTVFINRGGDHMLPLTSSQAAPKIETSIKEGRLLSQGVPVKSLCAADLKNLALSTSLRNNLVNSASDIVPTNGRDKGKSVMPQLTGGSSYNSASQEHYTGTKYHSYSSLRVPEKQMSSLLDSQRPSRSKLLQGSFPRFPHNPIAGNDDDGLYAVRSQHHKIQNLIANPDITNQTAFLESTKPHYGVSSSARGPRSAYGVKGAKIYARIDSAEELSRGHPNISQTTHQFFSESMAPTKVKGNNFNEILDLSPTPPASDRTVECPKLETLGSSRKSEENENIHDLKCPTSPANESSPEPNTMDIDTLHENNLAGVVPLLSNKFSKDSQNSLSTQGATISARGKNLEKSVNTTLPDINKRPHELLTLASPMVDRETSTSRTHSLDVEQLFPHVNGHARSKSGSSSLGSDPSSRWVKRLKLCTLDSGHGTKSENIGEPSHVKSTNIFSKIMKESKSSMEAETVYHAEGITVPDPPPKVLSNDESSFTEAKETVDITLSHPWIQRWSHNRAACPKKMHESVENHEPKSSNSVKEQFKNKQFPSIAAMALMGKAMNCLNPSELTKKGPVMVWNTKRL